MEWLCVEYRYSDEDTGNTDDVDALRHKLAEELAVFPADKVQLVQDRWRLQRRVWELAGAQATVHGVCACASDSEVGASKANVDIKDQDGYTALHYSARKATRALCRC